MYNERFLQLNKTLHNDISFSPKVEMLQTKMNLYLKLPVYSLMSTQNIKDENIINTALN